MINYETVLLMLEVIENKAKMGMLSDYKDYYFEDIINLCKRLSNQYNKDRLDMMEFIKENIK